MVRRSCVFSLVIWLALAAAYFVFFNRYFEWLGNWLARGERREGGQLTVVAGPIQPLGEPVTSPFTGQRGVDYEYEIVERRPTGKRQNADQYDVVGFAMTSASPISAMPVADAGLGGSRVLDRRRCVDHQTGARDVRAGAGVEASARRAAPEGAARLRTS